MYLNPLVLGHYVDCTGKESMLNDLKLCDSFGCAGKDYVHETY
jgi:hypothetical protein